MAMVECKSCKRNVIPKSDGMCPNCSASTAGSAEVPVGRTDPLEAAAWRRYQEERDARKKLARHLRSRGEQLTIGGLGLAALGLIVSVATFAAATEGQLYVIWSGAVLPGIAMFVRGRSTIDKAHMLEEQT